ncbi:MAG: YkgJ family cysteine cluster protein [Ferruginibacter sp.]|nr:YkgJ family cysteine cluster protein [Ferruginibacter sp.]
MEAINLKSFKQKVARNKTAFKRFLNKVDKNPPRRLDSLTPAIEKEVWQEVDCLSCANCCKTMTPTYTTEDIKRISAHLGQTPKQFKDQWLKFDKKEGDWQNKIQPCQFLNLKTNMCNIYEIRPTDCSGFPYLSIKKMTDYMHVHKQNIEYCPATYKMVEKLQKIVDNS